METVTITDTAYGGYGIGRGADGRVLMIPFAVTGDTVTARITEDKKSFAYAELVELVSPSPLRAEAPHCPLVGECGGCQFGHIDYARQVELKKGMILSAFRKSPDIETVRNMAVYTSAATRFRTRVTFRIRGGEVGFFRLKSNDFIPVADCPAVTETITQKAASFAAAHPEASGTLYILGTPAGDTIARFDGEHLSEHPQHPFTALQVNGFCNGRSCIRYATPAGEIGAGFSTFFQGNCTLIPDMQMEVARHVKAGERVLELFAGAGFFTAPFVKGGAQVTAVEVNKESARLARDISGLPVTTCDVDAFLKKQQGGYDLLFVDPPRTGMSKETLSHVQRMNPARILSVSCNPQTLARDISRLEQNYRIASFAFFDMFPHTYHIECITLLERRDGGR